MHFIPSSLGRERGRSIATGGIVSNALLVFGETTQSVSNESDVYLLMKAQILELKSVNK